MEDKIKMMLIRTNNGCFISDCYATSGYDFNYHHSKISELLFDGCLPISTYAPHWLYINQYPNKIQRRCQGKIINERYEMRDKELATEKMPEVVTYKDAGNYSEEIIDNLYSYKYDREPDYLEDIECDIEEILSIDNFTLPPQIHYDAIRKCDYKDAVYTVTNVDIEHQLIDKIIYPPMMLHNSPCKFSSKQMYDITRQYILTNINKEVATVSSNYDFCFRVEKIIPLLEPETITYQNIFARTKRERNKIHTKIKSFNNVKIFEMTHDRENYRGYPVIPEMYARSEEELKQKVDSWLDGVMSIINKPLCTCPQCKGTGFIDDISRVRFDYRE